MYARHSRRFAFPSLRVSVASLRFAFRRIDSLRFDGRCYDTTSSFVAVVATGRGRVCAGVVAAIRSLLARQFRERGLPLYLTLFDGSLDLSLDFSQALSATRAQALSTMSLTSSCTSRVAIVCCIWRRWRNEGPSPPRKRND